MQYLFAGGTEAIPVYRIFLFACCGILLHEMVSMKIPITKLVQRCEIFNQRRHLAVSAPFRGAYRLLFFPPEVEALAFDGCVFAVPWADLAGAEVISGGGATVPEP